MSVTPTRWTPDRAGCIFAGSSNRTADELNAAVILLALDEGWYQDDDLQELAESVDGWLDRSDDAQYLSDAALAAMDWMNELIAPEDYSFEFDDGFYLYLLTDADLDE